MDKTKISQTAFHPSISINPHPQEDEFMYGNEELLDKLHKKIDKRLNIGYYCQMPANSRHLIYPERKYSPSRLTPPKRKHPVKKKLKKVDVPQMVDQQLNTSGEYVLRKPDPIVHNASMQWSYEEPMPEMENVSLQWSIEPINQQIQYTLESQIVQCQDASIQYSFYESEPEPEPQPVETEEKSMQCEEVKKRQIQMQCEQVRKKQISLQYDEPLPEKKQQEIQIDIPDQKQLEKINNMQTKISYLNLEKKKQQKINKKVSKHNQILKLKEDMIRLAKQIELTEGKQKLKRQRFEQEIQLQKYQEKHQREKKNLAVRYHNKANNKIKQFVDKLRGSNQIPKIDDRWKQEDRLRLEQQRKKEELQKEELQNCRSNVQNLTQQLKFQMFKRLQYENDSEDDTVEDLSLRIRKNNLRILGKPVNISHQISSMNELFPHLSPEKKMYVGSIIKNKNDNPQQPKQNKLNSYSENVRLTKAYWRQRSSFNYKYDNDSDQRQNRKEKFLKKFNDKINPSQIDENLQTSFSQERNNSSFTFSPMKQSSLNRNTDLSKNSDRYDKLKFFELTYKNMNEIKSKINEFFANELYFKYLYGETNKIIAGYELFSLFDIGLIQKNSIEIYRFRKYFVFSYRKKQETHFIVIYHDKKTLFYSKFGNQQCEDNTLEKIYRNQRAFKNFWAYHYLSSGQIYMGTLKQGTKDGYGLFYSCGVYYEGCFKNNIKEGKGILVLSNGDIYKGDFKNNVFDGEGVYTWANGQKYDGFFREGVKQGYGKQSFLNGDKYDGFYTDNKKQGRGKYSWRDGSLYEGQFVNDIKCGQGNLISTDGSHHVGKWENDSMVKPWNVPINKSARDELPLLQKKKINV